MSIVTGEGIFSPGEKMALVPTAPSTLFKLSFPLEKVMDLTGGISVKGP